MHITFAVGVAFWFILGVMLWNWPMMIANAVTFCLTAVKQKGEAGRVSGLLRNIATMNEGAFDSEISANQLSRRRERRRTPFAR